MFRFQSINHTQTKIKAILRVIDKKEVYLSASVVFAGIGAYFIGLMVGMDMVRPSVTIERFRLETPGPAARETLATSTEFIVKTPQKSPKTYVASKTGKKYHLPTCIGAKAIIEANKVWFGTKVEAEKAGYSPAGNCKGI